MNGLYPTGGYFALQVSMLNQYHLYGTILTLVPWEYTVAVAALLLYCIKNRTKRTIIQ